MYLITFHHWMEVIIMDGGWTFLIKMDNTVKEGREVGVTSCAHGRPSYAPDQSYCIRDEKKKKRGKIAQREKGREKTGGRRRSA